MRGHSSNKRGIPLKQEGDTPQTPLLG